jgi:archaellum biogenesis protein FlaJ (TadC family)
MGDGQLYRPSSRLSLDRHFHRIWPRISALIGALLLHLGTPRILAILFTLFAVLEGSFLYVALRNAVAVQEPRGDEVASNDQRKTMRKIRSTKILIGVLIVLQVVGWRQVLVGAPVLPIIVGILFNLLWITGLVLHIRNLRGRLSRSNPPFSW